MNEKVLSTEYTQQVAFVYIHFTKDTLSPPLVRTLHLKPNSLWSLYENKALLLRDTNTYRHKHCNVKNFSDIH